MLNKVYTMRTVSQSDQVELGNEGVIPTRITMKNRHEIEMEVVERY